MWLFSGSDIVWQNLRGSDPKRGQRCDTKYIFPIMKLDCTKDLEIMLLRKIFLSFKKCMQEINLKTRMYGYSSSF